MRPGKCWTPEGRLFSCQDLGMAFSYPNDESVNSCLRFDRQPFGSSQFALVGIAGEKIDGAEVKGRGHMQKINEAVAAVYRVLGGNPLGNGQHVGPLCGHNYQGPRHRGSIAITQAPPTRSCEHSPGSNPGGVGKSENVRTDEIHLAVMPRRKAAPSSADIGRLPRRTCSAARKGRKGMKCQEKLSRLISQLGLPHCLNFAIRKYLLSPNGP